MSVNLNFGSLVKAMSPSIDKDNSVVKLQIDEHHSVNLKCKIGSGRFSFRKVTSKINDQVCLDLPEGKIYIKMSEIYRVLWLNREQIIRTNKGDLLEYLKKNTIIANTFPWNELEEKLENLIPSQGIFTSEIREKIQIIWLRAQEEISATEKDRAIQSPLEFYVKTDIQNQVYLIGLKNLNPSLEVEVKEIFKLGKKIGEGAYGQVYVVNNGIENKAFKYAFTNDKEELEKAQEQIVNECNVLNSIHQKGLVKGIQKAPTLVKVFTEKGMENPLEIQIGHIGYCYESDYKKRLQDLWEIKSGKKGKEKLSDDEKKKVYGELYEIIEGLVKIKKFGIHGDIKTQNILVDKGEKLFDISDFGGFSLRNFRSSLVKTVEAFKKLTSNEEKLNFAKSLSVEVYSPLFSSFHDKNEIYAILNKQGPINVDDIIKIVQIEQSSAVVSLGCLIYEALIGEEFPSTQIGGVDWASISNSIAESAMLKKIDGADMPKDFKDLLKTMLYATHTYRSTIEKIRNEYNKIMEKEYPDSWPKTPSDLTEQVEEQKEEQKRDSFKERDDGKNVLDFFS
jgi:serine/threonine protein kinase